MSDGNKSLTTELTYHAFLINVVQKQNIAKHSRIEQHVDYRLNEKLHAHKNYPHKLKMYPPAI
jgi:hypothetical protein